MTASAKICLYKRRIKKNDKYPVKIRVIYQRKIVDFQTGVDLTEEEFNNLHIRKELKKQFEDITYFLQKSNKLIADMSVNFSWKEFSARYYNRVSTTDYSASRTINLLTEIENHSKKLEQAGSISSSQSYITTLNHLKLFAGAKSKCILFSEVTPEFLQSFEKYLQSLKRNLSYSSVGIYMRNIRAVFNEAISKKMISPEIYPFGKNKYTPPATKRAKKSLSLTDIEKLYNYQPVHPDSTEAWARDMWFFAYFSNGMNIKDIALLRHENFNMSKKIFSFVRAKTAKSTKSDIKEIVVPITEDIQRILDKWGSRNSSKNPFLFDILHPKDLSPKQIRRDVNQAVKTINKYLKRIAKNLELEVAPTSNFARHSFSTVLKKAGVPIEMISEQLGHSSIKTTEIYLGSFDVEQKREISKYLNAFRNKE